MSNENRAQQFESLNREIRRFIANAVLFNQQVADKIGLNATDYQVLNLLELRGQATPGELAVLTTLTTGGVTLALDRLESAGYIRRERNRQDRRSYVVRAVPAKLRSLGKFYHSVNEGMARLFNSYSEKQVDAILEFFQRANNLPRPEPPRKGKH
jgi:DNA-binding MarR family transcriptional regulator